MNKKHNDATSVPYRSPWWRRFFPAVFAIGILILAVPIITYSLFARDLQSKEGIMNYNDAGLVLLDRHGEPFFSFYQGKPKEIVPLATKKKPA